MDHVWFFFMNNGASLLFVACLYEYDCILQALLINGADIKVLIFVFKNIKTYDMYLKQYDLYLRYIWIRNVYSEVDIQNDNYNRIWLKSFC